MMAPVYDRSLIRSSSLARPPLLKAGTSRGDFLVLAPLRRVLPLVVAARKEDEAVSVSVAEDSDDQGPLAQAEFEQPPAESAAEAGSAHVDPVLLQDLPQRGANRPPILGAEVVLEPGADGLMTLASS
jgi:hypothetical protein